MKYFLSIFLLLFILSNSFSQVNQERKIENIKAFAKSVGYIQYFYPSDEASALDWNKFIYFGIQQVENNRNDRELITTLNNLFIYIAPLSKFGFKNEKYIDTRKIKNEDTSKITYWQHNGFGFGDSSFNSYANIRINRINIVKYYSGDDTISNPLFALKPKNDTILKKKVSNTIYLHFPLVLQCDSLNTFPIVEKQKFQKLIEDILLAFPKTVSGDNLYVRLSNITILWNALKHFYPYSNFMNSNYENLLTKYLSKCYVDKNKMDFFESLGYFCSNFNDAHIGDVNFTELDSLRYVLPLKIEKIKNEFVVEAVESIEYPIKVGDIIESINGIPTIEIYNKKYKTLSGSAHFKNAWNNLLITADFNKDAKVKVKSKGIFEVKKLQITKSKLHFTPINIYKNGYVDSSIYFLSLNNMSVEKTQTYFEEMKNAKAVIIDIRRRPKNINPDEFFNYLISKTTNLDFLYSSQIIFPDYLNVNYTGVHWLYNVDSSKLLKAKIYIITGALSMSYSESLISYFKYFTNATLIGQTTAGINGDIVSLNLLGSYNIAFTGKIAKKQTGEVLFAKGFAPDIYAERTLEGIKNNRDEFVERAILEAKKYLNNKN